MIPAVQVPCPGPDVLPWCSVILGVGGMIGFGHSSPVSSLFCH